MNEIYQITKYPGMPWWFCELCLSITLNENGPTCKCGGEMIQTTYFGQEWRKALALRNKDERKEFSELQSEVAKHKLYRRGLGRSR